MAPTLSFKYAGTLYCTAFFIRALVMIFIIQPNGFFKQADSMDYHNCAVSIAAGNGMHRIDTQEPIFWRTPGYPPYLAFFYRMCGIKSPRFEDNTTAQKASLWVQTAFASIIPIILFFLASILTHTAAIAYILAWIGVLHPGLVLASTYLLTEGLSLIFFYLFLLCFFYALLSERKKISFISLLGAAFSLGIYTWMRPMGEFIGLLSFILLWLASYGSWTQKTARGLLFAFLFFGSLLPWYTRNYQLTGEWFFCPTIGTYLNCFSVPKILRRTLKKPIEECHKIAQINAGRATYQKRLRLRETGLHVSNNVCKEVAYPVIKNYPWFFIYDWIAENLKTTFDLYGYQLIPMINGSYWYDPIEEYLPEKITACLWNHEMPWYGRAVCWIEFIFSLLLWIGLLGGLWIFVLKAIITKKTVPPFSQSLLKVWIVSILMIGIIIGMTGGFGYARLRLPAEPLMLILSLTFWYWIYYRTYKDNNPNRSS